MRRIQAITALRKAEERARPARLIELRYRNVTGLGDGVVSIEPFLTTIVGANGAGKSSLLVLLSLLSDPAAEEHRAFAEQRLRGATLSGRYQVDQQAVIVTRSFDENGLHLVHGDAEQVPITCRIIDLAQEARSAIALARSSPFGDLIEGLSPKVMRRSALAEISALVRREYTHVETYEVERSVDPGNPDSGSRIVPLFRVSTRADREVEYSLESMGVGEAMLFVAKWHLSDQRHNELLLLEEVDSHIPDFSKDALLEQLADYAGRTAASIVISTHSARIVTSVPSSGVRALVRRQSNVSVNADPQREMSRLCLDIEREVIVLACCEDELAAQIAREILRRLDGSIAGLFEFASCDGDSFVLGVLKNFPPTARCLTVVGILDGDQRGVRRDGLRARFAFLPGSQAPERWLKTLFQSAVPASALALRVEPTVLETVLSALEGVEHHDWVVRFGRHIGRSPAEIVAAAVDVGQSDADVYREMQELVEVLRACLPTSEQPSPSDRQTCAADDDASPLAVADQAIVGQRADAVLELRRQLGGSAF